MVFSGATNQPINNEGFALFDTHCHLDYIASNAEHPNGEEGTNPEKVLQRAAEAGVRFILNPSVSPKNFDAVIALAERFENVYAAVAVHPTDVADIEADANWLDGIEARLSHPKVVAIGETGLDYYWDTSKKELQQACFRQSLALGVKHDLPVIVHDRDAHEDIHAIVQEFPGVRGIMHCFSGDAAFAQRMMACGFYISFAGNVTFKNATNLHEAAKAVPLDRLLIETDSPFLSPMPHRGKPNEPARVRYVAEKIADLRGISVEAVAQASFENALRVYGLSL